MDIWQELQTAQHHPYVNAAKSMARKVQKLEWTLGCQAQLEQMSARYGEIERRHRLKREDFYEQYYTQSKPVVITGMMEDWPALSRWNLDYLKEKCGDRPVEIQFGRDADELYEINGNHHKKTMPLAEYIDLIHATGETNDFYMTANNFQHNADALQPLWGDVRILSEYLDPQAQHPYGMFWLGPKGTLTPLHHDLTNNFMAQVFGRKLVRLVPANQTPWMYNYKHCYSRANTLSRIDYERYPLFSRVKSIDVVLAPGELLFIPIGYWHEVTSLDVSMTFTLVNFLLPNRFSETYRTWHEI
jgi:ribosomal protein L16 Arg81 hydroxylase